MKNLNYILLLKNAPRACLYKNHTTLLLKESQAKTDHTMALPELRKSQPAA